MKHFGILMMAAFALATGVTAETSTIAKNDPRPLRIHNGQVKTPSMKTMMRELAAEVKRVTDVELEA